jgi:AcrR family transcriptional regulator
MNEPAFDTSSAWLQPGAASSEKGKKRLANILQVAREIFAIEGYSNFTLRRVASQVGIHLASLQHYFATKEDLLGALLDDTNLYHDRVLEEIMAQPASSAEERFVFFIRHQLAEHQNIHTCGFFFQIWSLAPNYKFAQTLVDKMYANYRRQLFQLMGDMRPDLEGDELQQRAALIMAMLEGMMLLIGGKKKTTMSFNKLCKKAEQVVTQIVNT